jgi:hypothetical protein
MRSGARGGAALALIFAAWSPAGAAPIDGNLALVVNGGGCFPISLAQATDPSRVLERLLLVDPEWSLMNPVVVPPGVDPRRVAVHGLVIEAHGDMDGDFPETHVSADQVTLIQVDPADERFLARANYNNPAGVPLIQIEWESGAYPPFAWPGEGDRVVAQGRWIFDCGHPDPRPGFCTNPPGLCLLDSDCPGGACVGTQFNYFTEIHPPVAEAVIRASPEASVGPARSGDAAPAVRADVFASNFGGAAGDACVLQHRDIAPAPVPGTLLAANCYPLAQPVGALNDADFEFDLPLPPRPQGGSPIWTVEPQPDHAPLRQASQIITPVLDGPSPHLAVRILLSRPIGGALPDGYAATIRGGWRREQDAGLSRVRVTVEGITVLDPRKEVNGLTSPPDAGTAPTGPFWVPGWRMQASVNGHAQRLTSLQSIATESMGFFPQDPPLVFDEALPPGGQLRVHADGTSSTCVAFLMGRSFGEDLTTVGFDVSAACLTSNDNDIGAVDVSQPLPAALGEHNALAAGGAFSLHYRVDLLSGR